MTENKDWLDLLFMLAPLLVCAGGFYLLIKKMFDKDYSVKAIEQRLLIKKETIPLRFQAFERMTLFLERISPNNLVVRIMNPESTAGDLQQELLIAVRSEYEHNLTQQVYLAPQTWLMIKNAKEDVIRIINSAAAEVSPSSKAIDLSTKIFEVMLRSEKLPVQNALDAIKIEAGQLY